VRSCLRVTLICSLLFTALPARSAQRSRKERRVQEIAALKRQVQELQAGQQQILAELREMKKLLAARMSAALDTPPAAPSPVATLNVRGEPFKGASGARFAIVEYSDFECSFCGKYAREIYPQIIDRYVKTGKIRYYFRDYPLPIHPNAMQAALAARCAAEQGKFWEMHDSLFANQAALNANDLMSRAVELGLDQGRFSECFAAARYVEAIRKVSLGARQMGMNGTPAFAIGSVAANGEVVTVNQVAMGADSFEEFQAALDELLKSSAPK